MEFSDSWSEKNNEVEVINYTSSLSRLVKTLFSERRSKLIFEELPLLTRDKHKREECYRHTERSILKQSNESPTQSRNFSDNPKTTPLLYLYYFTLLFYFSFL